MQIKIPASIFSSVYGKAPFSKSLYIDRDFTWKVNSTSAELNVGFYREGSFCNIKKNFQTGVSNSKHCL